MPPSDPAAEALGHLDAALAKRPEKDGYGLSAALRCLGQYRDSLVAAHRGAPDGRHRKRLEGINALISTVLAVQYPLGEEQWTELEKARDWLAGALA